MQCSSPIPSLPDDLIFVRGVRLSNEFLKKAENIGIGTLRRPSLPHGVFMMSVFIMGSAEYAPTMFAEGGISSTDQLRKSPPFRRSYHGHTEGMHRVKNWVKRSQTPGKLRLFALYVPRTVRLRKHLSGVAESTKFQIARPAERR
ncbi:hypothetical protein AAL_07444 [Moelleriella libera RCEF 2490]|uniref:Uncharacterized protein n=1 Tax=Moelleriella libera RCEF 2490 TaxID=1081109 RepID=A0A167XD65_9HYPO|nr:hypothetical protein AAL_07444 [Moelleriella libera RCEF 2490]